MNRKRHSIGENDVPLDLWPTESENTENQSNKSGAYLNDYGVMEGLVETPRGASVSLGERALALADIMNYYNQANKTRGAIASPGALRQRYGDRGGYEVSTNMKAKSNDLGRVAKRAFETLTAEDEMLAAGFHKEDINYGKQVLVSRMAGEFGPGKAYARDRQRVVRRAQKVAALNSKQ